MEHILNTSELKQKAAELTVGDRVLLSGTVYTARDAAHKRIVAAIKQSEPLPFNISGATIYYAGPTPAGKGLATGSCGPTTSKRMDVFTPPLLQLGLTAMIGKGERSSEVCRMMKKTKAVYFCAIGGAGALACKHITSCQTIAFDDLGCESVKKLTFQNFPLIVAIDSSGNNIFERKNK